MSAFREEILARQAILESEQPEQRDIDWKEANRIIAAWGPMFPKPPSKLLGGKYAWKGCRETTQFGEMCRVNPFGAETCPRHSPINKIALKRLYRPKEMPIEDYCRALGLNRHNHNKYREKVIESWFQEIAESVEKGERWKAFL